jgi:hypothetical protein
VRICLSLDSSAIDAEQDKTRIGQKLSITNRSSTPHTHFPIDL